MTTRTRNTIVVFNHPFELRGVDRTLPAGEYRVMTDEQLIEELSFPAYRRVSTVIFAPGQSPNSCSVEMVTIDPRAYRQRGIATTRWRLAACQKPNSEPGGRVQASARDMHRSQRRRSIWTRVAGWLRRGPPICESRSAMAA